MVEGGRIISRKVCVLQVIPHELYEEHCLFISIMLIFSGRFGIYAYIMFSYAATWNEFPK
jgi:hypothetical protein